MFKFDLGQRVSKPNAPTIQAVITARTEYCRGEPNYCLEWTTGVGNDGREWFIEGEVLAANSEAPAPSVLKINLAPTTQIVRHINNRLKAMKRKPAKKASPKRKR